MPYTRLVKMKKFSKLRIAQLWDDCRIFAAWFSSIKKGKKIFDKKTGKQIRLLDCVKRFARTRGLLWALGYEPKRPKKNKKTTPAYREMWKLAAKSVKYYYHKYKGKVAKRS